MGLGLDAKYTGGKFKSCLVKSAQTTTAGWSRSPGRQTAMPHKLASFPLGIHFLDELIDRASQTLEHKCLKFLTAVSNAGLVIYKTEPKSGLNNLCSVLIHSLLVFLDKCTSLQRDLEPSTWNVYTYIHTYTRMYLGGLAWVPNFTGEEHSVQRKLISWLPSPVTADLLSSSLLAKSEDG